MVARVLYRDALMLVIDKPAGFAVHKGPKGGESLEDHFGALRFGLPRGPRWRIGSTAIPPAASCSAAIARRWPSSGSCSRPAASARPIGPWWRAAERAGGPHRAAARPQGRDARLVDEARSRRPARDDDVDGAGALCRGDGTRVGHSRCRRRGSRPSRRCRRKSASPHPAGARAAHRPHPSAAGTRRHGMADPRRQCLWRRPARGGRSLHLHAREVVVLLYKNRAAIRVSAPVPPHMEAALRACGWTAERIRDD